MDFKELDNLSVGELLELTQTNVTHDPSDGFRIAQLAYDRAETPIEKGTAARQGGFRAEQAGQHVGVVEEQFKKSRDALYSKEPSIRRELIATEILTIRTLDLRIERAGDEAGELAVRASEAGSRGEEILQEQHGFGKLWDRFGTMLTSHRALHEAMNGNGFLAFTTATRGIWRAVRAKREGTPESHKTFVVKQVGVNAVAGALAVSKPFIKLEPISDFRHKVALFIGESGHGSH